jgi:hypothetical protein
MDGDDTMHLRLDPQYFTEFLEIILANSASIVATCIS